MHNNEGTPDTKTLTAVENCTFVAIITHLFSVEERDIISHWFKVLCD